ncbi:MAG: XRE family transcriptional regulator [Candidatus Symbiothrix sp.]|nr:XRE family transcriptional regulator [Candidatus Symbiothrix sp.]
MEALKQQERSIAWLARQIHTDRSNLCRQLKTQSHLHAELLYQISIALQTDFFACYSQLLAQQKAKV